MVGSRGFTKGIELKEIPTYTHLDNKTQKSLKQDGDVTH